MSGAFLFLFLRHASRRNRGSPADGGLPAFHSARAYLTAKAAEHAAKDLQRASKLPLLHCKDSHVEDLNRIRDIKDFAPLLLPMT
jgi:hypothetical protein